MITAPGGTSADSGIDEPVTAAGAFAMAVGIAACCDIIICSWLGTPPRTAPLFEKVAPARALMRGASTEKYSAFGCVAATSRSPSPRLALTGVPSGAGKPVPIVGGEPARLILIVGDVIAIRAVIAVAWIGAVMIVAIISAPIVVAGVPAVMLAILAILAIVAPLSVARVRLVILGPALRFGQRRR